MQLGGWVSLKWFIDLDRLCARGTIDWEKVERKAKLLRWEQGVRASLSICASLFGTSVHPAFRIPGYAATRCIPRSSDPQVPAETLLRLSLLKTPARKPYYLATRLFIPTVADC
jgi:hypothetical protein